MLQQGWSGDVTRCRHRVQVIPTGLLQTLQTQPLKESSADPSVSGLITAMHAMHDLLLQYRQVPRVVFTLSAASLPLISRMLCAFTATASSSVAAILHQQLTWRTRADCAMQDGYTGLCHGCYTQFGGRTDQPSACTPSHNRPSGALDISHSLSALPGQCPSCIQTY